VGLGVRGYVSNCSHSFGTDCPEIGRQALPRHYLGPGGERYHPGPFHSTMPIATFCGTHQTHPTSVLLVHTNGTTTISKKVVDIRPRRDTVRCRRTSWFQFVAFARRYSRLRRTTLT
jgi:hypothetical protein